MVKRFIFSFFKNIVHIIIISRLFHRKMVLQFTSNIFFEKNTLPEIHFRPFRKDMRTGQKIIKRNFEFRRLLFRPLLFLHFSLHSLRNTGSWLFQKKQKELSDLKWESAAIHYICTYVHIFLRNIRKKFKSFHETRPTSGHIVYVVLRLF